MKRTGRSMWTKLMVPILVVMLLQSAWFIGVVLFGGVSRELEQKDLDILKENTENVKLYTEQEMVRHWIGSLHSFDAISGKIEVILAREGKTAADIKTDPALNRQLLQEVTEDAIALLHRSAGNGVYLVLDGPAAENSRDGLRAGVYIRDMDASSYAADHSDLLLERGAPSISRKYGIPLDTGWKLGFDLAGQGDTDYYEKPYEAARKAQAQARDADNYGYLSMPMQFGGHGPEVMSYSIPLIIGDDTLIGVFGLDLNLDQITRLLNTGKLTAGQNGIAVLGRRVAGSAEIVVAARSGPLYDHYFAGNSLVLENSGESSGYLKDRDGSLWSASISPLQLYSYNTPFEAEQWLVVGLLESANVLESYHQIRRLLVITLITTLIFGIIGVFLVGKMITSPIGHLARQLRTMKRQDQVRLGQVYINEIDELSAAIELLSRNVAENAAKISNILDAAKVALGVFEYSKKEKLVFCSRSLSEMLGWEPPQEAYSYMEAEVFREQLNVLYGGFLEEPEEDCRVLHLNEPRERWLELKLVRLDDDNILGVLTDVTLEMAERERLEWESRYDALTEIYNRRAFIDEAERILEQNQDVPMAFIMMDLDNLKYINDTYGHEKGDLYIQTFGRYLQSLAQDGAVVSRYSGDEFMVLLYKGSREEIRVQMAQFMERMKTVTIAVGNGYTIPLRASAGISWYPDHARKLDLLFTYSDFAMYMAKHSVKGVAIEFKPEEYHKNSYMISGMEELNQLIESKRVTFAMQPIVARDGTVYGYEFLMRPELKFLKDMGEVLNLAKSQGKLSQLEELTMTSAFGQILRLDESGGLPAGVRLFINSISSVALPLTVEQMIGEVYKDYVGRLVAELTEEEQLDRRCLTQKLAVIKRWNCLVAVDDLGSGYNSEAVLMDIRPDIVKLDMKLIRNIHKDPERQGMLAHLLGYLRKDRILVVAEGVETIGELEYLMAAGIDLFQGFYIGRPELEIRPLNPFIVEKMRKLSQN